MFKERVCIKDMISHVAFIMFYIMDDATMTMCIIRNNIPLKYLINNKISSSQCKKKL